MRKEGKCKIKLFVLVDKKKGEKKKGGRRKGYKRRRGEKKLKGG